MSDDTILFEPNSIRIGLRILIMSEPYSFEILKLHRIGHYGPTNQLYSIIHDNKYNLIS